MCQRDWKRHFTLIIQVYAIALPLIFSASLGNILEVVDLTVSAMVDLEISKAISFLERFRFVYGAILIGFTSTLSMYLNRLIPHGDDERIERVFGMISRLTILLGLLFSSTFGLGIMVFSRPGGPTFIYGIGTAINILIMFWSTPFYIALMAKKKTAHILKVGILATALNGIATWLFAKHLGMGTIGIIAPTVAANLLSFSVLRWEAHKIAFVRNRTRRPGPDPPEIIRYSRENTIGSLAICLTELFLVIVALKLGNIGVLYGVFFVLEKLFNSVTHAVSNSAAIRFAEGMAKTAAATAVAPFYLVGTINSFLVTLLSVICLKLYQQYVSLDTYLPFIVGIVLFNSIDYYVRKVILRTGGDARWTKNLNLILIAFGNLAIGGVVWLLKETPFAASCLFGLLLLQAVVSAGLVLRRVQSGKWHHAI